MENLLEKDTLIVKYETDGFEKFYCDHMKNNKCDVVSYEAIKGVCGKGKVRKILKIIKNFFIKPQILKKNYKYYIVFEDVISVLIILLHKKNNEKVILWNWNLKSNKQARIENLIRKWCDIWTFDKGDAIKYNWKLNHQFYFNNLDLEKKVGNENIAFCACLDKGRYATLSEIHKKLEQSNVKCDFYCVMDKNNFNYKEEDKKWIYKSGLHYDEYMTHLKKADILVDLVQKKQTGMTVRVLEAIYSNKKLITNNLNLKLLPIYSKYNIYIWGDKEAINFEDFLKGNMEKFPKEILETYSYEHWLENFKGKF